MLFTSKKINYFITVAQEGSIIGAADKLCITPSPLSKRIKDLESDLGITLFYRSKYGVTLTKDGQGLYNLLIPLHTKMNQVEQVYNSKKIIKVGFFGDGYNNFNIILGLIRKQILNFNIEQHYILGNVNDVYHHYDILFCLSPVLKIDIEPFIQKTEGVKLISSNRLSLKERRSLPFLQDGHFLSTNEWCHIHHQLKENKYCKDSMQIDNYQLRLDMIKAGYGICIVPESTIVDMQGVEIHNVDILDAKIKMYIYVFNDCVINMDILKSDILKEKVR